MNKTTIIIILMLAAMQLNAETIISEGNVNGTWTKLSSPYRIQGDIEVTNYDSLLIEAGVVVDFEGHHKFLIRGVLTAEGTIADTIRFTRWTNDTSLPDTVGLADTSNHEGSWDGIEWSTPLGYVSSLSHCIFEFINTVDNSDISWQAHRAPFHYGSGGGLSLKNSVIQHNYGARAGGIYVTDGAIIDSCLITNNRACKLNGSTNFYTAGGIVVYYSDFGEVTNCVITNNSAYWQYAAGGMRIQAGNPLIMNNVISNNISNYTISSAGGIYCEKAYPRIIQNLIVNNESPWAGGIYYDAGGGKLYNNTICNNKCYRNETAGVNFEGSSGTIAMNNIIYGNENFSGPAQISLSSISSQPVVKYNLIGNGMDEILGNEYGAIRESDNFFGDPSFVNPTSSAGIGAVSIPEDWQLSTGSSIINQGNNDPVNQSAIEKDMAGNKRINFGNVDPGCFELRVESYTPDAVINSPEIWIADTVHITRDTELRAKVTIYPGTVVLSEGHYSIYALDTLYAIGTDEAPILWTMKDTTGFSETEHEEGGWGPIIVDGIHPRIFRNCVFEYGKVKRPGGYSIGLIWGTDNGNVEIDKCIFRNCHGIVSSLIYTSSGANYTIKSSSFYNNKITPGGQLIYMRYSSNIIVRDNLIYNNDCTQDILQIGGSNIDFINNSIYHNTGSVTLSECFNLNFVNNTILKNTEVPYLGQGDNAMIINSILPDLRIYQEGYNIISSYVPEEHCTLDRCTDLLTGTLIYKNPLPYSGIGPLEEILQADYSLSNISPGINFGAQDTLGLNLSKLDIFGNPRINDGRIDIGAYENQGSLPLITSHPTGGTFCLGDGHILHVDYEGSDTVTFNWYKDGIRVLGQDKDNSLELDSILTADEGNYHCEISNSYGKALSSSVYIKVNVGPEILVQPEDTWHESGKSLNFNVIYTGSSPVKFRWEKDGQVIPDENLPEYRFTPADSSMEGNFVCTVSNTCDTVKTDPAALYLAPQICMVTISETTGNNLVVWEKKTKAPILAYKIYRESVAAGIYDLLATMPYDDLSVFVDTNADPTVQAYLYKITALLDTLGNETDIDLCKPHKTVHLIVSTNPELNTTQLQWDRYYGFDYNTYSIYRSNTGVNFDLVQSISANLNSWTDPDPSIGDQFYRIAVEKPDPCTPEGGNKKAGTGPYVHSLSNMDDNKLRLGENPPDSIMLDNHFVDENKLPGSLVGRLTSRDLDSVDYHTYHLVSGTGDQDNGSFSLIGDLLIAAVTFDYETKDTYFVRIRSTDNAAIFTEETFTININDTEETSGGTGTSAPDSMMLSNHNIDENNLFGDLIGRLTTRDPDTFDIHSYQLVQGSGDDDNSKFMILGDMIMAAHQFDFEDRDQYTIRIRSTDLGTNHIEKVFIVNIIDVDETVGIMQPDEKTLRIYPNPFSQSTTIRFPNPSGGSYRMVLMDLSGKVYRIVDDITTSEYVLKKGDLKEGLYFIELRGPKVYRGKIVIE